MLALKIREGEAIELTIPGMDRVVVKVYRLLVNGIPSIKLAIDAPREIEIARLDAAGNVMCRKMKGGDEH